MITRSITRRSAAVTIAGGTTALMALATRTGVAQDSTPAASPATESFPLTVTTANGTTEVPAPATRVVALSFPDVDTVVALEVTPVGVQRDPFTDSGISLWFTDKFRAEETTVLDIPEEVPLEDVVALTPDLILDTLGSRSASTFDTLNAIAPTVSGMHDLQDDVVSDRTRLIGRLLGRSKQADLVLADVDAAIVAFATEYPELEGKTFAFGSVRSTESIGVIADPNHFVARLFSRFGLTIAPALTSSGLEFSGTPGAITISLEQIQLLDADIIFLSFGSPATLEEFEASPVFQALTGVQRGNFIQNPLELATAMNVPSVGNLPWALDQFRVLFQDLDFIGQA